MSKQLRFIFLLAFVICSLALAACRNTSSNIATTSPSPTAAPAAAVPSAPGEMKTTPSGLQYQDLQPGSGQPPLMFQSVRVTYVGTLPNGRKFDSGLIDFRLGKGEVIKGWDWGIAGNAKEGIEAMRVGGKRKLIIPPQLGYGDKDMGDIPPNSTLVFEIELVKINSGSTGFSL